MQYSNRRLKVRLHRHGSGGAVLGLARNGALACMSPKQRASQNGAERPERAMRATEEESAGFHTSARGGFAPTSTVLEAITIVFARKYSFFYFAIGVLGFGFLYGYVPIFLTPGNSFKFFLHITPWWSLLLLGVLAMLMGLLVAMQMYVWQRMRHVQLSSMGAGLGAGFSSFISGIFSSATCAACVSALFSFLLPPAGVLLLLEYRWWITAAGLGLVIFSLLLTSKRIVNNCQNCGTGVRGPNRK